MRVVYSRIYSPALGHDMHVWAYGHYGRPLLAFPSAACSANNWADYGMIHVLAPWIAAGKLKVYCTSSVDGDCLLNPDSPEPIRVHRMQCFEDYVLNNLVPAIRFDCRGDVQIATAGVSSGGYHAVHWGLKRPDIFPWALGMSGKYDIARLWEGYGSQGAYFSDVMSYSANMHGPHLDWVRRHAHIILTAGRGPHEGNCLPETERLGAILRAKGVSSETDIWGHDAAHHWFWWKRQLTHHIGRALGNPWG
ncbi:MAG: alpha/beta hydrolase-fold protein [Candidatus Sumerlaeia bacterium]|nr:alpha/beta hydrolase-fold protein [Candidatus Sumerlaeia bacterium]